MPDSRNRPGICPDGQEELQVLLKEGNNSILFETEPASPKHTENLDMLFMPNYFQPALYERTLFMQNESALLNARFTKQGSIFEERTRLS